jgi:hypothetical protein
MDFDWGFEFKGHWSDDTMQMKEKVEFFLLGGTR